MKKEDIEKYIENRLNCRLISNKHEFIYYIIVTILFFIIIVTVILTFIHNDNIKERIEILDFCDSVYQTDHVVLEQCKNYFIIYGSDN